ncbi:MAG: hypothetical protein ACU0DI_08155 [Paracoccaceae bacterium]
MCSVNSAGADSPVSGRRALSRCALLAVLCLGLLVPANFPVHAAGSRTIVVLNDRGGSVIERARLIQQYKSAGTRLEIRGKFCLSACTMFLGLSSACVASNTVFGFHGPSSRIYGIGLRPEVFEHWSRIMADHYPEPLKSWFLDIGRHRTVGFHIYNGSQLIGMGIKSCSPNQPAKTG